MKTFAFRFLTVLPLALALTACGDQQQPGAVGHDPAQTGLEYGPDMYHSLPLEPYAQMDYHGVNPNGQNLRKPAAYSIARGKLYTYSAGTLAADYPYPATNEGYEAAGAELRNPIASSPAVLAEGKRLYQLNCVHCHGDNGNGQGKVSAAGGGPFAGVPSYIDGPLLDLPDGKMFHTITYGKNLMGSHATQLNPNERWMVVHYINELQNAATGKKTDLKAADSTAKSVQPGASGDSKGMGSNQSQSAIK